MTPRRELQVVLLLCLVAGAAVLGAGTQDWIEVRDAELGVIASNRPGRDELPAASALAWVVLAAVLAVVSLRGSLRRFVGVIVLFCGLGIASRSLMWLAFTTIDNGDSPIVLDQVASWPLLSAFGGLVACVAGAWTAWRGSRWAGLGSSYEAPGAAAPEPVTDKAVWDALDRGDDPTA